MGFNICPIHNQLVVSTHVKNISQIGSFPQVGVKIKNVWNHHLDNRSQPHFLVYSIRMFARQLVDGAPTPPLINGPTRRPSYHITRCLKKSKTHIARVSSGREVKQHVYIFNIYKFKYIHIIKLLDTHTHVYLYITESLIRKARGTWDECTLTMIYRFTVDSPVKWFIQPSGLKN